MSNLKISVTQDHIDTGERDNCSYCPIALAVKASKLDGRSPYEVAVGAFSKNSLMVDDKSYTLPDAAITFYEAFDGMQFVRPFEFEAVAVEVPS